MVFNRRGTEYLWLLAALLVSGLAFFFLFRSGSRAVEEKRMTPDPVCISEIVAANLDYPDGEGRLFDWIEVENQTGSVQDLSGWGLSDEAEDVAYTFPQGTVLPPRGYLLVYCDRKAAEDGPAPFGISSRGDESVYLFRPDGTVSQEIAVPVLSEGESYSLEKDGSWIVTDSPTPALANNDENREAVRVQRQVAHTDVVFSELMSANRVTLPDEDGEFSDWIELWNPSEAPVDLTGWHLSDDRTDPRQWEIPALILGAGERTVIFCSGKDRTGDELHTNFALSKTGGVVLLSSPEGAIALSLAYQAMEKDEVLFLSLSDQEERSFEPTPGYAPTEKGREAFLAACDRTGSVVINEAVPYNDGRFAKYGEAVYDWIELKNISEESVSLSGWTLSTDLRFPDEFSLPDRTLAPGEMLVIHCAGEDAAPSAGKILAPFRLSTQDERVYLYTPDGTLSDRVFIRDLPYGGSIGRLENGAGFYLFEDPTPGKENADGYRYKAAAVEVDTPQGIYNDVDALIVTLSGEGEIHYTLDGSAPTDKSPVYEEPITLTKTTIVRAFSRTAGRCAGDTATFSYIINEDHVLPVATLACDPGHFKDMYQSKGYGDECDAVFTLFNDEGMEFTHGCTVRLHGNTSRYAREQKPMVIEFNGRFGGDLLYDVFSTGEITQYSSLMLRGETVKYAYILRDSVASVVAEQVSENVLALDNRYIVLYVNGEYYGVYPLREDYSRQYVASHTGSTLASCRVEKGPVFYSRAESRDLYWLLNDVINGNMADDAKYEQAAARLDLPAFADWLLLQGFFNNHDVGGNIRYIYGDNTDGKWRPAFYDLDISMAGSAPGFSVALYGTDQINQLLKSLMCSPRFKTLVQERAVILLRNGLATGLTLDTINEFAELLEPEIPRETVRWLGKNTETIWPNQLKAIRHYFRPTRVGLYIDAVAGILGMTQAEKEAAFGEFL